MYKTPIDFRLNQAISFPLLHFFHNPEMGEAQTLERGLFQPLQQGTQETAKPGPAGDDVVVRAEDRFPLDKPDRQAGK